MKGWIPNSKIAEKWNTHSACYFFTERFLQILWRVCQDLVMFGHAIFSE